MNRYLSYILGSILGIAFYACSGAEETEGVSAASGFQITLVQEESVGEVRKTPAEIGEPAATQFHLKIVNDATQKAVYDAAYKSGFIAAGQGVYTVTATCGTDAVLAIDAPYYKGVTNDVEVPEKSSLPVTVTVACRVANALASVFVKEEDRQKFANLYTDYWVEVALGTSSASLRPDGKSAYYQSGTLPSFTFKGILKANGQQVSKLLEADALSDAANFAAGQHIRITLGYQPTVPGLLPSIEKVAVETVTVSQTLPVEWLPAPKISSTGFDTENTLDVYETETGKSATIDFAVASPLQDVEFTLDFQDEVLAAAAVNKTYRLSQMTSSEVANLRNIGIVLPVVGERYPSIGLTSNFLDALLAQNGTVVKNRITIHSVKANNRTQKDNAAVTYTIATHQPEFSVSVLPGNIWTKEFTISELSESDVVHGNYQKLHQGISYQYSTDGREWINLGSNRLANGLNPDHQYYIRVLYRIFNSSPLSLRTYAMVTLSDLGVDSSLDNYTTAGNDGKILENYGRRFYWTGWETLNELTCDYCLATAYAYNTRSGSRPISDAYAGNAVWIATIGWGYGSTIGTTNHQTPGELFLGSLVDINHDNDTATKNYGISYTSHPTHLSFYYKYTPYDGDKSDIIVQVLHDDIVLGEGTLQEINTVDTYTLAKVLINYVEDKKEYVPNKLVVVFKSGFNTSVKNYGNSGLNSVRHVGSQLFIDEVALIYDR